jgi:hypothetical protein
MHNIVENTQVSALHLCKVYHYSILQIVITVAELKFRRTPCCSVKRGLKLTYLGTLRARLLVLKLSVLRPVRQFQAHKILSYLPYGISLKFEKPRSMRFILCL